MDALRVAAPLARLLLAVGEAGREGEVSLVQRGRPVRLSIARGRVTALSGIDMRPLGDTLLALGALDVDSQRSLLEQSSSLLVGARLVAAGATSSGAVLRALELQLTHGVHELLRWPSSQLMLQRSGARRVTSHVSSVATVDLTSTLWSALLELASALPAATVEQLSGHEALALTGAGTRRVRGLLHAVESGALQATHARRAMLAGPGEASLDKPSLELSPQTLARALAARPRAPDQPLRALLRVLGAAIDRPTPEQSYALLLRKTRELSRNESANVLLDLPKLTSSVHARQALRRLAHKLHPDRFQAGDARLHALSHRVMGALAQAEYALRPKPGAARA